MNPSSLDWSIQSALSSLFPPFEATAPTVLSQLFRTIEERYHGDALQCLLNFLIPAKHILESVQQAACAAYSDVLFQCEGWPLCLRDRVVIQLAPINPLLLRPGDFYLQVEPFGEQSARIVLKSLLVQEELLCQENLVLQAGSRVLESPTIEGTPIPETSYPCIFTESWLKEINEGRHGNPLHLCVLSSDHGVVKVPWTKVSNPEFLDRPKSNIWPESKPCSAATIRVADIKPEISEKEPQPGVLVDIIPQEIETGVLKVKDDMAFSVQVVEGGSRLVKIDQGHPISSFSGKPIGWVSPNTWDSRQNRELEGEYVDLLEFNKEKANFLIQKIAVPPKPWGFQVVRTAQAALKSNMSEEFLNQTKQPSDLIQNNPESKCRYRQSYVAALRNPVNFERADIMVSLNESSSDVVEVEHTSEGYGVGLRLQPSSCIFGQTPNQAERNLMQSFENSAKQKQSSTQANQSVPHDCSWRENAECPDQYLNHQITNIVQVRQPHKSFPAEHQDLPQTVLGNKELLNKRPHCLNDPTKQDSFHMRINAQKHAKNQHLPKMGIRALPDHSGLRQDANLCLQGFSHLQNSQNLPTSSKQTPPLQFTQNIFQIGNIPLDCNVYSDNGHYGIGPGSSIQVIKGKSRSKIRSSSLVSETFQENKLINRSRSDVYPEIIPMLPTIQGMKYTVDPLSPKLNRQQGANKVSSEKAGSSVEQNKSQFEQLLIETSQNGIQAAPLSKDPTVQNILQLGIICLPGGRDRAGRAVVEVYGGRKGWASLHISPLEVCKLLLYLHSIPRPEVRELGLTVVIDSRKCLLPSAFYKSLLMVQEQALHAVHTIMMLVNKEANPRLEKQPGLQIDVVTSLKALHKTVDGQQLTSEFAGTFTYSHEDWIHFHQKLSLFQLDLQAASSLLQSAIRRLDVKNTDSAKDVEFCIQEQRSSMKRVLEDTRLVGLQQVGGSILARLRKEVSRFAHSEDFRDCLELVTCLYNQVEEGVHTLVMKSNQLLQHLEHVLLFRKTQESLNQIQKWCESQEQSWGKDEDGNKEKSLQKIDRELQDIQSVLKQAKEKKEKGMQQIKEVQNKSRGADDPESAEFHSKSSMFKTILTGFLLKAEERKSELQTTADLYRFCQEASSLVQECMEYLDKIKTSGCLSSSHLITLKDFQERFQHFTPQHFQNRRAALLQKLPDGVWIWTALQHQCRDIRLRLSEMLKALEVTAQKKTYELSEDQSKCLSGSDLQIILDEGHTDSQNRCGGYRNCDNETVTYKGAIYNPNMKEHDELDRQHILEFEVHKRSDFKQSTPRKCCRGHSHSDTDLRQSGKVNKLDYTSCHRPLMVRSHSEESCSRSFGYNDYLCTTNAEHECKVIESCPDRILVEESDRGSWEGAGSELSHHDSFSSNASGLSQSDMNEMKSADNMSLIPRMEHADQGESVCRPDVTLENSTEQRLQRLMAELVQTEREYVCALGYVLEHYVPELERPDVPQELRGQRGSVFGNLEKLKEFHQLYFLQELEQCLNEPFSVGRCFVKHKESFGLYSLYSKNKPHSEKLLMDHGKDFFKQKQRLLSDQLDLSSYLLKPVQRISKYSLLLQELLRECVSVERSHIQTALTIVQSQLTHANNLLAMDDIQACDVNLKEQGPLVHQDEFLVTFRKKKCYRHIFLFRDLILFSKTCKSDIGNDTYIYKQSFKTSDIGMTHNSGESGLCFEIWFRRRKSKDTFTLQAASREVKENWTRELDKILWQQAIHNREIRMQERVFMGLGHKPFMDIQPSEMAISDRAVNGSPTGRDGLPMLRMSSVTSVGSRISSSSSSSGWTTPSSEAPGDATRFICETTGILAEEDLHFRSSSQSTLVESLGSSGESCFSAPANNCSSVKSRDCDVAAHHLPDLRLKKQHMCTADSREEIPCKAQATSITGKSTEV